MFNLTTSNSVGYNGVSQIPDARCTPPYDAADASPGDKLRAYLHSEVQTGSMLPGDRKIKQLDSVKSHQLDDVYTFKDSDLHISSHSIHSNNSRLRSPLGRKSDVIDKGSPESITPLSSPRSVKQMNGYSPLRNNIVQNGIHDSNDMVDGKSSISFNHLIASPSSKCGKPQQSSDLFTNIAMGDRRRSTDSNCSSRVDNLSDTKSSIIRCSVTENAGYDKQKIKEEVVEVKTEPGGWSTEGRVTTPLFSTAYKLPPAPTSRRTSTGKPTSSPRSRRGRGPALHEALQRITSHSTLPSGVTAIQSINGVTSPWVSPSTQLFDCLPMDIKQDDIEYSNYLQPWLEGVSGSEPGLGRAERLASRRSALRRRTSQLSRFLQTLHSSFDLHQTVKLQLEKQSTSDNNEIRLSPPTLDRILASRGYTTLLTAMDRKKLKYGKLLGGGECIAPDCSNACMACAVYCSRHIVDCPDQALFSSCTAKFSDNTECKMPVVNVTGHLPLCDEHAWKRDNYNKISQELKPKKAPRKRPKPSAMIRPQKRNRKRKKPSPPVIVNSDTSNSLPPLPSSTQGSTSSGCEESAEETGMTLTEEFIEADNNHHIVDEEVVAQVLGLQGEEARAPSQDGNIDLSAVFHDFFTAEQNEEYVPTREETEELERALEAVNQDVKSLEKLTASQGPGGGLLLESFLDERALAETLASLPDVFSPSPNCTA